MKSFKRQCLVLLACGRANNRPFYSSRHYLELATVLSQNRGPQQPIISIVEDISAPVLVFHECFQQRSQTLWGHKYEVRFWFYFEKDREQKMRVDLVISASGTYHIGNQFSEVTFPKLHLNKIRKRVPWVSSYLHSIGKGSEGWTAIHK